MEIKDFFDQANHAGTFTMSLKMHVNVELVRMAEEPRVKKARRLSKQLIDDTIEEFQGTFLLFCEEMLSERNALRPGIDRTGFGNSMLHLWKGRKPLCEPKTGFLFDHEWHARRESAPHRRVSYPSPLGNRAFPMQSKPTLRK
jgi:hypothetical protein